MKRIALLFFTLATLAAAAPGNASGSVPQSTSGRPLVEGEKSKGKALMLSFLLPGLGERYAGATTKSHIFLGTEISLWLGYAGFQTYSAWRRDEYEGYAARHAGVDPKGKNDTYYSNIGNYANIDLYNAAKLRQRNLDDYYSDVASYYWKWDTAANKAHFDQLRISSEKARNRSTFVLGAILANHLVSAIDAVWSVNRYNNRLANRLEWNLHFGDGFIQPRCLLSLQTHF
ncbi:MAG TPA: hypothetical protein PKI62_00940 [bacterium]|nr:hypothetical protein [bacterium]HPR86811.1 hypothetical protein [bacterium]